MNTEQEEVKQIFHTALQVPSERMHFLGRGATSAAWRVSTTHGDFIFRYIPKGTNRPTTYQSEFTILRLLRGHGCAVPKPIMNSAEYSSDTTLIVEPWAVTSVVQGCAIKQDRLPAAAATSLGELLAVMDSLPIGGFGRLKERPSSLVGMESNPIDGSRSRWCWAKLWPLMDHRLEDHTIGRVFPQIIPELEQLKPEICGVVQSQKVALSHADLHGEHIFVKSGKLTGVIDFGAAFIGSRSWDFASLAFYHGWNTVQQVVDGYTANPNARHDCQVEAQWAALILALYKLEKAAGDGAPKSKIKRIAEFIEVTLRK